MVSLERCRELIDQNHELTDERLEQVRDDVYQLASVAVEAFVHRPDVMRSQHDSATFYAVLHGVGGELATGILERAAIAEFDGGVSRDEAERAAVFDFVRKGRA